MIGIMHRNGTVYRFQDNNVAMDWLAENQEIANDITVFSSEIPDNSIPLNSTLYMRQCNSCDTLLKFEVYEEEHLDCIICPKCQCRSKL